MGATGGQWYPPEWPDRIRALARGELTPVPPRRAATVMLLRDGAEGAVEVFLLRRRASMAFAAGAYAYPGGSVDPRDGPDNEEEGGEGNADGAVVAAAVRETFEEAGVLLAGPPPGGLVADVTGADWEEDRAALAGGRLPFADFLNRRGLVVRTDLLGRWARWITPEFEARRYDTHFFVAALPAGQRTRNASTEADRTLWLRPGDAVAAYERGELLMMPPTITTLRELAPFPTVAEALAAARDRDVAPIMAQARVEGREVVLSWPGYEEFEKRVTAVDKRERTI
ncbi:NUDIX domain-containing protein [Streptomyces sp. MP131-18]|uniref:NUDIX hydrolase n=1 Tax=Streptomyces sp. MP131-18 TaxID=1857892 RepID=UPI00097C6215|nr:NUDIX domain-containing protein [Streptomyces sp. MP131-18]ONK13039.1 NUDIX domain protein [Streptomyces sp. MP131-18]